MFELTSPTSPSDPLSLSLLSALPADADDLRADDGKASGFVELSTRGSKLYDPDAISGWRALVPVIVL